MVVMLVNKMSVKIGLLWLVAAVLALSSCTGKRREQTVINLSFTPWVGYYPFHFAIEKNIPQRYDVELRVLETLTVQDFRRTNIKEHVDAFASSMMELIRTNSILEQRVEIIQFLDYSNGADVILARKSISSLAELEGKVVGFDWRSLGHYFLHLALAHENLPDDIYTHLQVEQVAAAEHFEQNKLDAYVTYPPISSRLLQDEELHVVFDSSKIPYQIMDVLAMKKGDTFKRRALKNIWRDVTVYIEENSQEYEEFVAGQMGISPAEASQEIAQVVTINSMAQENINVYDVFRLAMNGCAILGDESERCVNDLQKLYFNNRPVL